MAAWWWPGLAVMQVGQLLEERRLFHALVLLQQLQLQDLGEAARALCQTGRKEAAAMPYARRASLRCCMQHACS